MKRTKDKPPVGWGQGQIDFGENGSFLRWWAEQQEHWTAGQITILAMPFFLGAIDDAGDYKVVKMNFIFLSDDHSHSPPFIQLCLLNAIFTLLSEGYDLRVFQLTSDRCDEQFFNRNMFVFRTRLQAIIAVMQKRMKEGGDLSEFRMEGATQHEEELQEAAECVGITTTKTMIRSAVVSGFYLGLGKNSEIAAHLPAEGKEDCVVNLIDSESVKYVVNYKAARYGLSGNHCSSARCGPLSSLTPLSL